MATLFIVLAAAIVLTVVSATQSDSSKQLWGPIAALLGVILGSCVLVGVWQFQRTAQRRRAMRALDFMGIDQLSGFDFERYLAELFRSQGYKVQLTPINDYGVDLVIVKNGERTAVQAKRYRHKPVRQEAVREAVAGMMRYKCTRSMVVTNSVFTKAARELADSNNCRLIDRPELGKMLAAWQASAH